MQSRFEAARGLAPPYRPAIAALPGHNAPRRRMASTVASLRVVAPASVASKRGVTLRARAPVRPSQKGEVAPKSYFS